ncbi:MAG: hypothetical protein D3905_12085 [Candidatus Electrothrix sp. AS4_5]|nr:hypothetical protein [Candidatus Electrothrix gigas]
MMTNWKKYTKFYFSVVLLASLFLTIPVFLVTAEEAVESGHTPAKALIEKKCTVCHSTDRVYGADKNQRKRLLFRSWKKLNPIFSSLRSS